MPISIDWRDGLTIISFLFAVDGYRRFFRQKALMERARRDLMRRVAADAFRNMSMEAYELEAPIVQGNWERSLEKTDRLRLALAEANGSWSEFLVGPDGDKSEAASAQLMNLQSALPCVENPDPPPSQEQALAMRQQCATAYTLLGEIAGKLKWSQSMEPVRFAWLRRLFRFPRGSGSDQT
jgi:hypothetical protein